MDHQFREDGSHYNGGAEFFGYGYRAVGEPRLKMIRRWYRQGQRRGQTEDRFFVDGEHVATYDAALAMLALPPKLSAEEIGALSKVDDEPRDLRKILDLTALMSLRDKGLIAFSPPGKCARTDAGRAYLAGCVS